MKVGQMTHFFCFYKKTFVYLRKIYRMIGSNLIFIKPKEHYVALKRKTHYYLDNIYKKIMPQDIKSEVAPFCIKR